MTLQHDARKAAELPDFEQYNFPNWNGVNAEAIKPRTLKCARAALAMLYDLSNAEMSPAPGADGSIGIEWRWPNGRELWIDFNDDESVVAAVFDRIAEGEGE